MRNWGSSLVLLLLFAAPGLGQNASVNVRANADSCEDCRPFGKYLVETCTLAGEQLTLTCTKVPYPTDSLDQERHLGRRDERTPCPPTENPRPCQMAAIQPKDQTITIKLICDPAKKDPCDLTDPQVGADFFVSATADSGLPVQQTVLLGNATPVGGSSTVHYRANAVGPIVIRASRPAISCGPGIQACNYAAAPPVDLILQVKGATTTSSNSCPVLPPSAGSQSKPLDAPTIVSLLGNPTPFIVAAEGSNTIFIYATRLPLEKEEPRILGSFQQAIAELAGRTAASLGITPAPAKPFSVELRIPHGSALGDLATRIGGLNYSQFTVQDVGRGSVRVIAPTQPDCDTWKGFLTDIREMAWQLVSTPMSEKLFYLSSSDVAAAFSGLASPGAAPAAGSASAAPSSAAPATAAGSTPSAAAGGPASAPAAGGSTPSAATSSASTPTAAATPSATSSNATIAINQPPGSNIQISSDTTPCVVAGLAFGNSSACGSAPAVAATPGTSSAAATPSAAPAPPAPLAMASVAVAAGTGEQTPPDLLVYSDANPGDDAQIAERNRILAGLDLPRPEMILSAWVTQNSTANPQAMGAFNNMVKGIVADYNKEYEYVVLRGWLSLKKQQSRDKQFFNEPFRSYISDRFVADTSKERKNGSSVQNLSQAFLDQSQATMADPISPVKRTNLGICERKRYCLGYSGLFSRSFLDDDSPGPIKPALTDLLLTIIAAEKPVAVAERAVKDVEGTAPVENINICDGTSTLVRKRCRAIWRNLDIGHVSVPPQPSSCEDEDFRGILSSLIRDQHNEPRVRLRCFLEEAKVLLAHICEPGESQCTSAAKTLLAFDGGHEEEDAEDKPPYGVGLFRAAIADFLFNYKMSQQYPHEFVPYDLTQSANTLNNALSPLIDAFSRDLWSYQMFVRADMQYQVEELNLRTDQRCCVKKLFGLDKPSFFNDGVVTVRTISGQPTSVSVTSQSFLNGSTAPELPALLNSLASLGAPGGGGGGSSTTAAGTTTTTTTTTTSGGSGGSPGSGAPPATGLFGIYGALPAVLANYQTSYAQIGRQLSFTATPRSLATASSAEIAVTLNADESAGGPLYTGPGATDPAFNTSRVANHDTTTRVRVDSIKLFEVSSFSAIVERSRSRFPLLPPFVEIPYIGTFAGIPLGSAKEFHSSTAVISAYVVPTATDIAYGLRFVSDLAVDGLNPGACSFFKGAAGPDVKNVCVFRKMFSLYDVGPEQPIREFNKNITRCFATDTSSDGCRRVSFDNALESN
jgi:hypothetical protein